MGAEGNPIILSRLYVSFGYCILHCIAVARVFLGALNIGLGIGYLHTDKEKKTLHGLRAPWNGLK